MQINLPEKVHEVFARPHGEYRYRVLHGGRGSAKSRSVATMALLRSYETHRRILCTREIQNSIRESMHAELRGAIEELPQELQGAFDVGRDYIRNTQTGSEFIFRGLRHNIDSIKSMSNIDLCVVEESETVPHESWRQLIPTLRAEGSEFWIVFNPKRRDSWVAQNFLGDRLPPRTIIRKINYTDNPWFPPVLEEQRAYDREVLDPALYRHIWEGDFYERSAAQVFAGRYEVREFEAGEDWDGAYYGLDFGFAQDPTAAVRCWVYDNCLWIDYDYTEIGLELDATAQALIEAIPDIEQHTVRADCARPESISYLQRHGLSKITPCKKGAGSVEDGIKHILSYKKIIVHPRCKATINELDLYSYKIDRLSGDILPALVDSYNHCIDALRYSLEPIMHKARSKPMTFSLTTGTSA